MRYYEGYFYFWYQCHFMQIHSYTIINLNLKYCRKTSWALWKTFSSMINLQFSKRYQLDKSMHCEIKFSSIDSGHTFYSKIQGKHTKSFFLSYVDNMFSSSKTSHRLSQIRLIYSVFLNCWLSFYWHLLPPSITSNNQWK
jgi:hypothetical protein